MSFVFLCVFAFSFFGFLISFSRFSPLFISLVSSFCSLKCEPIPRALHVQGTGV